MPPPPPPPAYGVSGGLPVSAPVPASASAATGAAGAAHRRPDAGDEDKPFFQENPLEMVGLDPDELLQWAAEAAAEAAGGARGAAGAGDGGGGEKQQAAAGAAAAAAAAAAGAVAAGGGAADDLERGGGRRRPVPQQQQQQLLSQLQRQRSFGGGGGGGVGAGGGAGTGGAAAGAHHGHHHGHHSHHQPSPFKALSLASAARNPRAAALALLRLLPLPWPRGGGGGGGGGGSGGASSARPASRLSSSSTKSPGGGGGGLLPFLTRLDRAVLKNVAACAGASMADPIMSVVDTHFVGRLGVSQLAAMGPNSALFSVLYFLLFTSLAVLCTQAMAAARARGDPAGVGRGFAQAMAAALALSVPAALLLATFPDLALGAFHAAPETLADARAYCVLRALALPAALTMVVCQAAFRSLLDLRTPLLVVAAATAANLILDQALMFGPVARWGVAGCGVATLGSQYIGAALFALCVYRRRRAFGLAEALREAAAARGGKKGGGAASSLPPPPPSLLSSSFRSPRVSASSAATTPLLAPVGVKAVLMDGVGGGASDVEGSPAFARPPFFAAGAPPPGDGGGKAAPAAGTGAGAASTTTSSSSAPASSSSSSHAAAALLALLRSLEWRSFCARAAALSARGLLILSTYTSAALVAARHGTAAIAGHQVVQQQQQLQLSVAWSFMHVGQAMVAAAYHAPAAAGGGKWAARRVAGAVIRWGVAWSLGAAAVTFALRDTLPGMFAHDEALLALVRRALPPAALMLSLAFNSAVEGALLGADDAPYVVRCYPFGVACCLSALWGGDLWLRRREHRASWADSASAAAVEGGLLLLDGAAHVASLPLLPRAQALLRERHAQLTAAEDVAARGLRGVWVALAVYYAALLVAFAHRYWVRRVRI